MKARKSTLIWGFTILGMAASALLVVGRAHAESLGFSVSASAAPGSAPGDVSLVVTDDVTGQPVADAAVALGDSLESLESPGSDGASRALTGSDGSLLFKGALARSKAVTVSKAGYSTMSIVGLQDSSQIHVFLKPQPPESAQAVAPRTVIGSGDMTGWTGPKPRDHIAAGLVFRSLSAFDLLHFQPDSLISPITDSIDVMGRRDIPSNISLPQQDVFLLIGSIHLNKPNWRLPVTPGREIHLAGVQGQISAKDLLAAAQGGKMSLELLNKLKFNRAGLTAPLKPEADFRVGVSANFSLTALHKVTVSRPPFPGDVLVAAAADMHGDRSVLLPTDIKLGLADGSSPKAVSLVGNASIGQARDVLTIAMGPKAKRLSGIMTDSAGANVAPGEFLPIEELGDSLAMPAQVTLKPTPTGVSAAVYESPGAALAYVYTLPGAGVVTIPSSRLPAQVSAYSVVSLDFGPSFDARQVDGKTAMRGLKRFARANAQIGPQQP